jgi:Holliday junction resolvase
MGKMSRDKGAAGEREFASVAREYDLEAERTAQLQAGRRVEGSPDVTLYDHPQLHVEVKRDERMSVDRMVRQSVEDASKYRGDARVPLVAWRRNGTGRKGWRIDCPAAHYLGLLSEVERLRSLLDLATAALTSPESTTHTTPEAA